MIVSIATVAIVFWLLTDNGKPPPPPSSQLVGLWRFAKLELYTVEFRPDSSFIMTYLGDKDHKGCIWNRGAYVVDDTKNPAWIDINGISGRTFEMIGGVDIYGAYKGLIRFLNDDVAEIAVGLSPSGERGRPDSFDGSYIIVIHRIKRK
ncbi:MAG: hypothetical protein Q8O04_00355 [Deltaproteobacteria bacterium]|nr:hypothetical protein [Deltaproteobacteria bacterium]